MVSNKLLFVCFVSIAFIYFTMKPTVTYLDSTLRTLDPGPRTPDPGPRTPDPGLRTLDSESKDQGSNSLCNVLEESTLLSPSPSPLRRINVHLWTVRANWRNVGEGGGGSTSNRLASRPGRVAMSCRFTTQKPWKAPAVREPLGSSN